MIQSMTEKPISSDINIYVQKHRKKYVSFEGPQDVEGIKRRTRTRVDICIESMCK